MTITKGITDRIFRRYFPESVIWWFSEKIQLIYTVLIYANLIIL
jgi:hypothetical protein